MTGLKQERRLFIAYRRTVIPYRIPRNSSEPLQSGLSEHGVRGKRTAFPPSLQQHIWWSAAPGRDGSSLIRFTCRYSYFINIEAYAKTHGVSHTHRLDGRGGYIYTQTHTEKKVVFPVKMSELMLRTQLLSQTWHSAIE